MAVTKATTTADVKKVDEKPKGDYVRLVSPLGHVSTVPVEIEQPLRESGYTDSK